MFGLKAAESARRISHHSTARSDGRSVADVYGVISQLIDTDSFGPVIYTYQSSIRRRGDSG
jgi:hypothetical protein